jgi:hypothetical protein
VCACERRRRAETDVTCAVLILVTRDVLQGFLIKKDVLKVENAGWIKVFRFGLEVRFMVVEASFDVV